MASEQNLTMTSESIYSRREFLKATGAAIVMTSLPIPALWAENKKGKGAWAEDFEQGFVAGASIARVRGWNVSIPDKAIVAGSHAPRGNLSLWLSDQTSYALHAIPAPGDELWVDTWLHGAGARIGVKDRRGRVVAYSSREFGTFSASELATWHRICTDMKVTDNNWRRVTLHLLPDTGRYDFYLNGKCVLRHLLYMEGSQPQQVCRLQLGGPGGFDDPHVSRVAPPKGLQSPPAWYPARPKNCLLRIAHISDTHLRKARPTTPALPL